MRYKGLKYYVHSNKLSREIAQPENMWDIVLEKDKGLGGKVN